MYKISLPIRIPVSKKSYFALNLNVYRNAHYITLNNAKVAFKEMITPFLAQIPHMESCSLEYILYPKTNRLCDVSNICTVVDKFFSDALVETGHIPDDNYTYIKSITYRFGSVDKDNPRVDVIIRPEEPNKENDMQITIIESEIKEAINLYLQKQIGLSKDKRIAVEFAATRGSDGMKAFIDIIEASTEPAEMPIASEPVSQNMAMSEVTDSQEQHFDQPKPKSLFSKMTKPVN